MNRTAPTTESDGGHLARAFDDERHGWTRAARWRQRAVCAEVALLAVLLTVTVAAAATDADPPAWFVVTWTLGLFAFIPVHSVLNAGIRGLYDRRGRTMDEHQRALHDRSLVAVRWPSTGLTLLAWAGAVAIVGTTQKTGLGLAFGFLCWFAATLLPYWHLGWTLPDEDADGAAD